MKVKIGSLLCAFAAAVAMAYAGGASAEPAVRIEALEEFRAVLRSLAYVALPNEDFDYIKKSKTRFELAFSEFKDVKLPEKMEAREDYFEEHHELTKKAAERFKSVIDDKDLGKIKERLLNLEKEFTLLMAMFAPTPQELATLDKAVAPLCTEHVEKGQFDRVPDDLSKLSEAVKKLSDAKLHPDLGFLADDFAVRSTRVRNAALGLNASVQQEDTTSVKLAASELQRASESMKELFKFWEAHRAD